MQLSGLDASALSAQARVELHNAWAPGDANGLGARERGTEVQAAPPAQDEPRRARTAAEAADAGTPLYRLGAASLLRSRGVEAYRAVAELLAPQLIILNAHA